jgi:hypothetical protein
MVSTGRRRKLFQKISLNSVEREAKSHPRDWFTWFFVPWQLMAFPFDSPEF